jgi:hypothetical protein
MQAKKPAHARMIVLTNPVSQSTLFLEMLAARLAAT